MSIKRTSIASLGVGGAALIGLLLSEGYTDKAMIPVPGDVPTVGFGTTAGVKMGDTTTPTKALVRALSDVQKFEGAVKRCVNVPLHQHEYDAFISLAYNIGQGAFCGSTLVRKLNAGDYAGACAEILRWNRAGGQIVPGLAIRREREHRQCLGEP